MAARSLLMLRISERAYRALLKLYPPDYRREYGDLMAQAFRDLCRDALRLGGARGLVDLWLHTLADVALTATRERLEAKPVQRREVMPRLPWSSPNKKLERFTRRAKQAMSLAQEEAVRLQRGAIGPEHLLLGLLRESGGVANRALSDLGLDAQRVAEAVQGVASGAESQDCDQLRLAATTKQALESAVSESRRMGHSYVGTEHLLLGLIGQPDSAAVRLLDQFDLTPDAVRDQVYGVLDRKLSIPPFPAAGEPYVRLVGVDRDADMVKFEVKLPVRALAQFLTKAATRQTGEVGTIRVEIDPDEPEA